MMNIIDTDIFFKIFIFTNSYALLRQFVSLNYSIEISNRYDEAMEYILQSHKRRQYHFILADFEHSDFFDCIHLLSTIKKDFPGIKRIIVVNRNLSIDDETLIKETFGADKILNLKTTNDFYSFFKTACNEEVKSI